MSDFIEIILECILDLFFTNSRNEKSTSPFVQAILSVLYTIALLAITIFLFISAKDLLNKNLIGGIFLLILTIGLFIFFIIKTIQWFNKLSR